MFYLLILYFQPIPVTDNPIPLPSGMMANQVVVTVLEKLDPDQPVFITINIWGCFDTGMHRCGKCYVFSDSINRELS